MRVQAYLNFDGRCEEALEFYRETLGAEILMMMKFQESPEPFPEGVLPQGSENKVMHASFRIGNTELMASDCNCDGKPAFQGISLALTTESDAQAREKFALLAAGGRIQQPLTKTFFSSQFGMVTDRFGVGWMIVVEAAC